MFIISKNKISFFIKRTLGYLTYGRTLTGCSKIFFPRCVLHLFASSSSKSGKVQTELLVLLFIEDSVKYLLTCYLSPSSLYSVTIRFFLIWYSFIFILTLNCGFNYNFSSQIFMLPVEIIQYSRLFNNLSISFFSNEWNFL